MATEETALNKSARFEASDGASNAVTGERPADGASALRVYVSPQLRHLGSVRQVTFGNTGDDADGTPNQLMPRQAAAAGSPAGRRSASSRPSSRALKDGITYLESADRKRLASDVLGLRLASYTYKPGIEPHLPADHRSLGFIIEDAPPSAPFVVDQKEVDVYAFASAILATLQEQQETIARLEREVADLRTANRPKGD